MRIFDNCKEAYPEILRDIIKFGSEVKSKTQQNVSVEHTDQWHSKELQCYTFTVLDATDAVTESKDPDWVILEMVERLNTELPWINPGEAWKLREDYWRKYARPNTFNSSGIKMDYSYNERMGPYLRDVIKALEENHDTRRAILSLWDQQIDGKNIHKKMRTSCSMYYCLQYRQGKLDLIYHMRSCDFYEHFRNDVALAVLYQNTIAEKLGWPRGKSMFVIDSLHIYKLNMQQLGYDPKSIF